MSQGSYAVSAGASGAIFGIVGALLYVAIRNHGRVGEMCIRASVSGVFGGRCSSYLGLQWCLQKKCRGDHKKNLWQREEDGRTACRGKRPSIGGNSD